MNKIVKINKILIATTFGFNSRNTLLYVLSFIVICSFDFESNGPSFLILFFITGEYVQHSD